MNPNDKMVFVVRDLNVLIKEYGMTEVQHALNYIGSFPSSKTVTFTDGFGNKFELSEKDALRVTQEYDNGRSKIAAIKLFREITSCGLKEAKDAIEKYFNWQRPSSPW